MADLGNVLSLENVVFSQFIFYATLVILKMMVMSLLVVRHRLTKEVFSNPEDLKLSKKTELKTNFNDQDLERVRRCHLNDLENIIPFVFLGMFYCLTGPDPFFAALHFRLFAGIRIFHTIAYLTPLPQPSRALGFFGGWVVTASMAMSVLRSATM